MRHNGLSIRNFQFALAILLGVCLVKDAVAQAGDRSSRFRDMFQQLDRNNNGSLEQDEIPEHAREFVRRTAERRGLNPNQPMSIAALMEVKKTADAKKGDSTKKPSQNSGTPQAAGFATPLTTTAIAPGFNVPLTGAGANIEDYYDQKILDHMHNNVLAKYDKNKNVSLELPSETAEGSWNPPIADSDTNRDGQVDKAELLERYAKKFNLPRLATPRTKTVAVSTSAQNVSANPNDANAKSSSSPDRVREYAQGLLNRYDKNKSGYLERSEWSEMKSDYHSADTNKDDVITLDELTVKLAGYGASTPSTSVSTTPTPVTSSNAQAAKPVSATRKWWQHANQPTNAKAPEKKTYRFLTPTERLPKGLPDWFARNDTNGDGQVMMSEYAATWTESLSSEFRTYDLDGDGIITPEECLAVEKAKKK